MYSKVVKYLLVFSVKIVGVFSFLIYDGLNKKNESAKWVAHTYEVILKSNQLLSEVKDAETGQRGYLLTGKPEYLTPYQNALNNILTDLDQLLALTTDNPQQQDNLNYLKQYVVEKLQLLQQTLDLFNTGKKEQAIELLKTDKGRIAMDSIRAILGRILNSEEQLLNKRTELLDKSNRTIDLYTILALLIVGTIAALALFLIQRQQNQNKALITELQKLNEQLESRVAERTNDLEKSNRELELVNQALVKINKEKNRFLGMAAHDLKSPLNNVKGLVGILKSNIDTRNAEVDEIIDHIERAITRMSNLISDLLNIHKIEGGKTEPVFDELNINDVVDNVLIGFKQTAIRKHITLHYRSLAENPTIVSDKGYLMQILENLVSNAFKFTPQGKDVFVTLQSDNSKIKIEIEDHGQGIKEDELPYIFTGLIKISTKPTGDESSTGLGLNIVKHLTEKIQGTITCRSTWGQGSTFTLELPIKPTVSQ